MVGVASLALFVLVLLMAIGAQLCNPPSVIHPPLKLLLPFYLWLSFSFFAKLELTFSFVTPHSKILAGFAVASAGAIFVLNNVNGAIPSPTIGGIVAVAWFLSWFVVDLTMLLIPHSWWKR